VAHPKTKISRSRRDKRRTHKKLTLGAIVKCPSCGEPKQPHYACLSCGTYNARPVLRVKNG
jgi:large subunit ribosomal protein L32